MCDARGRLATTATCSARNSLPDFLACGSLFQELHPVPIGNELKQSVRSYAGDVASKAELIDFNHRIVERLYLLNQMRAQVEMLDFKTGDQITFQPPGQGQLEGLARYNKKTMSVITDTGRSGTSRPPAVRSRVKAAKGTNTAGSNVFLPNMR